MPVFFNYLFFSTYKTIFNCSYRKMFNILFLVSSNNTRNDKPFLEIVMPMVLFGRGFICLLLLVFSMFFSHLLFSLFLREKFVSCSVYIVLVFDKLHISLNLNGLKSSERIYLYVEWNLGTYQRDNYILTRNKEIQIWNLRSV